MPIKETFLCFVDTETSGLVPGRHEVIEIAAILTDIQNQEISRIEHKIKMNHPDRAEAKALEINHYDPQVWMTEAVPFRVFQDWLDRLVPYGHVAIPVGHHVSFDRAMIDEGYYKPYGKFCPLAYHFVDTMGFATALRTAGVILSDDDRLENVCRALGISTGEAHRAMNDCEASRKIFEYTLERLKH